MTAGVNAEISFGLKAQQIGSADLGSPRMTLDPISKLIQFTAGSAAVDQANILFSDTRTLAASANEDIDLAGVLADAFGATIAAAEVMLIIIEAAAANVNNVNVSRPATNGFVGPFLAASDGIGIKPGEFQPFISRTGWAVTAATGNLLNIANSGAGTAVTYNIVVIARTIAA